MDTITRPALRYYGGKWRLAPWIISHFPAHQSYVEPCGGAASVLLQKDRSPLETFNDLDGNVVNFFRILRERPTELVEQIRFTPWARTECFLNPGDTADPLEKARRFWVQCWMTIAQTERNQSFRVSKKVSSQPAAILLEVDYLYGVANRLLGVQIENKSALEVIVDYDSCDSLVYFDPPYLKETRSHTNEYAIETDTQFHIEAAALLREARGYVVVSGYASQLYTDLYEAYGWRRVDKEALTNSGQIRTESLWLNPKTAAQILTRRSAPVQMELI